MAGQLRVRGRRGANVPPKAERVADRKALTVCPPRELVCSQPKVKAKGCFNKKNSDQGCGGGMP